jgi:hypothetical protein
MMFGDFGSASLFLTTNFLLFLCLDFIKCTSEWIIPNNFLEVRRIDATTWATVSHHFRGHKQFFHEPDMPSPVHFWEGFRFALSTWHRYPSPKNEPSPHFLSDLHFRKMYSDERFRPDSKVQRNAMTKICNNHVRRVVWYVAAIWTLDNWNLPACKRVIKDSNALRIIEALLEENINFILGNAHRMISFKKDNEPKCERPEEWQYTVGEQLLLDGHELEDNRREWLPNNLNSVFMVSALTKRQLTGGQLTVGQLTYRQLTVLVVLVTCST